MQDLVHFDGSWSSHDKATLERTIRRVENRIVAPVPDGLFGHPWICTRHDVDGHAQYIARRVELGHAFEAKSVDDLVQELEVYLNGH